MKRTAAMILVSFLMATPSLAQVTVEGHPACEKKKWFLEIHELIIKKKKRKFRNYFDTGKCIILRGGKKVEVTEKPGFFGKTTEFVFDGKKYWTDNKGIDFTIK